MDPIHYNRVLITCYLNLAGVRILKMTDNSILASYDGEFIIRLHGDSFTIDSTTDSHKAIKVMLTVAMREDEFDHTQHVKKVMAYLSKHKFNNIYNRRGCITAADQQGRKFKVTFIGNAAEIEYNGPRDGHLQALQKELSFYGSPA